MITEDEYRTVKTNSRGLYKEKGSKFMSFVYPVDNEEQIKLIVEALRKEYHDARHHCYAYRLGLDDNRWRVNDDGEPSGTGGRPIYGQILSHNLTNILIVVVRYFGGTKLGVSGLIGAYKEAALDALNNADVITRIVYREVEVLFRYESMNDIMRLTKEEGIEVINQQFDSQCRIVLGVRWGKVDEITGILSMLNHIEFKIR